MDIKWFFKGTNAFFTWVIIGGVAVSALLLGMGILPVFHAPVVALSAVILAARRIREVTR